MGIKVSGAVDNSAISTHLEQRVGQDKGGHGLHHGHSAGHDAGVVAAARHQLHRIARPAHRVLLARNRGRGLEGDLCHDQLAV